MVVEGISAAIVEELIAEDVVDGAVEVEKFFGDENQFCVGDASR